MTSHATGEWIRELSASSASAQSLMTFPDRHFLSLFFGRALTIAALVSLVGGCGKGAPQPSLPSAVPVQRAEIAGVSLYRDALAAQGREDALLLLEQSVRANPRLPEAWYELGRRKVKLAPDVVKLDEVRGVQIFREGLEAEKEALRLLDVEKATLWNAAEEDQARATLAVDLVNVDETLADAESSLRALRIRTY